MESSPTYSTFARRQRLREILPADKEDRPSLRKLAEALSAYFDEPVSHTVVGRDLKWLEKEELLPTEGKWERLLKPEHFPEWRREFFKAPGGGVYDTPTYQHAWFYLIYCFVFKVEVPQWVVDELGLPEEMNGDLLSGTSLLTAIVLAPPRHGKTELVIHAMIFIFCLDPNKRIIYCSGIASTSKDNMGLVMQELETNEKLINAYGPFKDEAKRWSYRDGFFLSKAQALKTTNIHPLGVQSNILSKDADLILVDDPQDLDSAESETTTMRDYRWFVTNLMTRREPHTPVLGFGSHQPSIIGDLWGIIEENIGDLNVGSQKVYMVKMKAHNYEECVGGADDPHVVCTLWPKIRPYWYLEAMRASLGDEMFEVCFNQDQSQGRVTFFDIDTVRGDYVEGEWDEQEQMFKIADRYEGGIQDRLRSWKHVPEWHCRRNEQLLIAVGVDPAASESKRASHTAITVLAVCRTCKRRFAVDYLQIKQSPEKHPDTILGFVRAYKPQRVRIEKNAYQKALARDPRLVNMQSELRFRIDEWHTDDRKNDPTLGIPTVNHMIEEGRFSIPAQFPEDIQYGEEFTRSLIRWPKKPNDIPMSLWLAELSIRELLYEAEYADTELAFAGWQGMPDPDEPYESPYSEVYEVDISDLYDSSRLNVW